MEQDVAKAANRAVGQYIGRHSGVRAAIRFQVWSAIRPSDESVRYVARRISRRPNTVWKWLADDFNLEIDHVSDLLLAVRCELGLAAVESYLPHGRKSES